MDDKHLTSKDYEKIKELVFSANQKSLQALLGFQTKKIRAGESKQDTLTALLPSTSRASTLLKHLKNKTSRENEKGGTRNGDSCDLAMEDILQALLMIDPVYRTPWDAIVQFAGGIYNETVSAISMMQCVSAIEEFFLKSKFPFANKSDSDEKVIPQGVRESTVELVKKVRLSLMLDQSKQPQLAVDLIRTVSIVSKGWCSDVYDEVYHEGNIRIYHCGRAKIFLQMAQGCITLMHSLQIRKLGTILLLYFLDGMPRFSPAQDVPSVITMIVDIASTLATITLPPIPSTISVEEPEQKPHERWKLIATVALFAVFDMYDEQIYLRSEKCLRDGIRKWQVASRKTGVSEIIKNADESSDENIDPVPVWFALNLVSLCIEVLREKEASSNLGLVNEFVSRDKVDQKGHALCLSGPEYQSILDLAFGSERDSLQNQDIDELFYRTGGLFCLENTEIEALGCLSMCVQLITDTLCLMQKRSPALLQAMRLSNMVDYVVRDCPDDCLSQMSIFAIIVKTVSYFEVPEYRSILEGKMEQAMLLQSRLQDVHLSALRLITVSALTMDDNSEMTGRLFGIVESVISISNVDYLDRILTMLPHGRSGILNISKKLVAPLYSSWGTDECESRASEDVLETKMHKRITGGVRGLMELMRNIEWGEIENNAWAILSDFLVNDLPPLPSDCRQWVVKTMTLCITDNVFDPKTVERLLIATTTRISSFFVDYEIESKILAGTKHLEEIRSLHRAMTVQLQYLVTMDEYIESRHILLAQGRESFLRALLMYKKGQLVGNQFHHAVSKQYHSTRGREPDGFILCWLIFLKINFYLLDNTMSKDSKIKTFGQLENSSMNQETSVSNLVSKIKNIEIKNLQDGCGADEDCTSFFPSWPHSKTPNDVDSQRLINVGEIENFACSDLLLEFLFSVPLPAREDLDIEDPLSWKVISASGFLISGKNASSKSTESTLSIETIEKTADPFLSTSSFLFRGATDLNCALSPLDDLLGTIFSYCQALNLTLETNEIQDCGKMIGSLWNLYQAMASERACVKIINYLEANISEKRTNQQDRQPFSLRSICSENDIDKAVRQLRLVCLRPFLRCISYMSSTEDFGCTIGTRSLVGGILSALVTDLRAGLDGKSGGIPRELYVLYCMTIEACGSLLFHERQSSFDGSVFYLFREVTTTLSNILVSIPLNDASLFRTTFILAVVVFPSMCRDLIRNSLCGSEIDAKAGIALLWDDSVLFDKILDDCIDILVRWAALREPTLVPWLDIAGQDNANDTSDTKEHYGGPNHSDGEEEATTEHYGGSNHSDSEEEACGEVPTFVQVPSPPRIRRKSDSRKKKKKKKTPQKIRLYTKELWSWALSCSLLGLEQKWLESERAIQLRDFPATEEIDASFDTNDYFEYRREAWNGFFGSRTEELQKSLLRMNIFFRASQSLQQRDQRGNHIILDMMAMNLPSAPRLRFCCLIECVSRVLVHSIRRLCAFAKDYSNRDLSVFESISCLSAWLSMEKDSETDFSVGVFKWLAIASRKSPPGSSKKADKAELYARVSTVSEQVHGLYLELKELQKTLKKPGTEESIGDYVPVSDMLRSCGKKLQALDQVIPSEFRSKSLPDFPTSLEPQRKRPRLATTRRTPRSKTTKSQPRKSRNKVVDIFMNLDKGTDGKNTRDAFADLEDFLVEG